MLESNPKSDSHPIHMHTDNKHSLSRLYWQLLCIIGIISVTLLPACGGKKPDPKAVYATMQKAIMAKDYKAMAAIILPCAEAESFAIEIVDKGAVEPWPAEFLEMIVKEDTAVVITVADKIPRKQFGIKAFVRRDGNWYLVVLDKQMSALEQRYWNDLELPVRARIEALEKADLDALKNG